jgi:hypothetical protein
VAAQRFQTQVDLIDKTMLSVEPAQNAGSIPLSSHLHFRQTPGLSKTILTRNLQSIYGGNNMGSDGKADVKKPVSVTDTLASDFFMSLFVMILCVIIFGAAWTWPRPGGLASAPGLFPMLTSLMLFCMSLSLFISSVRKKEYLHLRERFARVLKNEDLKPTLLAFSTLLVYLIIFLNLVSFEIGTFIYLVVSLTIFWKDKFYKILIISAAFTALYSYVFQSFFNLLLPGKGM